MPNGIKIKNFRKVKVIIMANHAMFRSDNMAGTTQGKYLVSVRVPEAIDNGCVVAYGAYEDGAREVRTCEAPAADTALGKIAILGSEEVNKAVKFDTVGGFTNEKGVPARGYIPEHADAFSVTAEAVDGTIKVGSFLELQAGSYKMAAVDVATGATVVGVCEAVEQDGATTWYVIRV
jgi:hypothetical protein